MNFFFDNCLAPRLARAIQELEGPVNTIRHLQDRFAPDTKDEEWITALAKDRDDWVIISGDVRITRTPVLREFWRQSGLTAFFLKKQWTNAKRWEQAWRLIKWWPLIAEQAKRVTKGSGFFVPYTQSGKFEPAQFR